MNELKEAILAYMKEWYKAEYIGYSEVIKDGTIYSFILGIPNYYSATIISGDFNTDEEFLEYIFKELRERNFMRQDYYKVLRHPIQSKAQLAAESDTNCPRNGKINIITHE